MHHLSLKSLSFYAVAIGSVVILFNVVSAYGESKIKAPPAIGGRYRINAANLPTCLQSQPLILNIQQSGIYLHGSLLKINDNSQVEETTAEEKPSLAGLWQQQQITLSGLAPNLANCDLLAANIPVVKIQGQAEEKSFTGKMSVSSIPQEFEFTAQLETPLKSTTAPHKP